MRRKTEEILETGIGVFLNLVHCCPNYFQVVMDHLEMDDNKKAATIILKELLE